MNDKKYTIVFFHGVSIGLFVYYELLNRLSNNYNIIAIELPNLNGVNARSITPMVDIFTSVYNVLRRTNIYDNIILMAHSMGSDYASAMLEYKNMYSSYHKIIRIILIDPVCFLHRTLRAHKIPICTKEEYITMDQHNLIIKNIAYYYFIHSYETQMVTLRSINNGGMTSFKNHNIKGLVIFGKNDYAIDAQRIYPYVVEHFKNLECHLLEGYSHGSLIESKNISKIVQLVDQLC